MNSTAARWIWPSTWWTNILHLVTQWQWGDSILEWIRQCEITFGTRLELRNLLRPDVWPHAGRSSFVTLLGDKAVSSEGVELEQAVGLRLTFRQPPPISCFSNQFLFYLNSSVGNHRLPDLGAHESQTQSRACRQSGSPSK